MTPFKVIHVIMFRKCPGHLLRGVQCTPPEHYYVRAVRDSYTTCALLMTTDRPAGETNFCQCRPPVSLLGFRETPNYERKHCRETFFIVQVTS